METLLVGLIVATAVLYSGWSLLPAGLRRSAARRLGAQARRWGAGEAEAARLQAALSASGGCSDCSSCKGCAAPAAPRSEHGTVIAMPRSRRAENT